MHIRYCNHVYAVMYKDLINIYTPNLVQFFRPHEVSSTIFRSGHPKNPFTIITFIYHHTHHSYLLLTFTDILTQIIY
jgi:hypothetical protein